jgi:hypothetical protein
MDCQQSRDWLLNADDPRRSSPEVAQHLTGCADCRTLASELVQLEQNWRAIPVPPEAEKARQAFLERLPRPMVAMPRRRALGLVRWAVAALLLLGVGALTWSLLPTNQAVASTVLIDQLIDWNLNLAQAATTAERGQIFAAQEAAFKNAVRKSNLGADDRELAGLLLENGSWLAANTDPLTEAELFSTVADKLVDQLQSPAVRKDAAAVDRLVRMQTKVARRGVSANLAKLEDSGALNFENERRLEKVILRDSKRMKVVVDLMERNPDLTRKDIRQALDIPPKHPKTAGELAFDFDGDSSSAVMGQPGRYRVKVHNQGSAAVHKLRVVLAVPEQMEIVGVKGPGNRREGQLVMFGLASLAPGAEESFEVQVKPIRKGEAKCRAELRVKQNGYRPLFREEKTTIAETP